MGQLISKLDEQFGNLHRRSRSLIEKISPDILYRRPAHLPHRLSGGEEVLRSAAIVEQTFGGVTANLWDDPFEWTLPETLSTTARIIEYLEEVETTRGRAFELFKSDDDLAREIMSPTGTTLLLALLEDTLARARIHQDAATAMLKMVSTVIE
jgi:hypothetical protein